MSKILDIIILYLRDYTFSFSGREIARLSNLSPQSALNTLNLLVKEKILNKKKEGRNYKYYLTYNKLKTKNYLQLAETYFASSYLDNFELNSIISELICFSETMIIFGSYAKKLEKNDSDIDLIAINGNKLKIEKAKSIFLREINVRYVTWNEFRASLKNKNHLAIEIKKNHLIYGNVFKVVEAYCE
mgnify:FL=1